MVGLLAQADGSAPSKQDTVEYLQTLRGEFLAEVAQGKKPEDVSENMGSKVFKGGMTTL